MEGELIHNFLKSLSTNCVKRIEVQFRNAQLVITGKTIDFQQNNAAVTFLNNIQDNEVITASILATLVQVT